MPRAARLGPVQAPAVPAPPFLGLSRPDASHPYNYVGVGREGA
jgi:hypothetical protein